ncbi:MAG: hypothetical protein NTZ54_13495 [Alphaproteobacteria bacterium]|nr:hypothetical protein [Alphaproteobacteria bacterium]
MSMLMNDLRPHPGSTLSTTVSINLDRTDAALIIDALLQAEMTMPLIDARYRTMKAVESVCLRPLHLANLLEKLMPEAVGT